MYVRVKTPPTSTPYFPLAGFENYVFGTDNPHTQLQQLAHVVCTVANQNTNHVS